MGGTDSFEFDIQTLARLIGAKFPFVGDGGKNVVFCFMRDVTPENNSNFSRIVASAPQTEIGANFFSSLSEKANWGRTKIKLKK